MNDQANERMQSSPEAHHHYYQADARATHRRRSWRLDLPPHLALWIAVAAIAVIVGLGILFAPAALVDSRRIALTPSERMNVENDVRAALIQTIGGAILIGGLYYTARQFRLTREGHITDRYAKSVELLGSDKVEVRIGAIYALERIARDSPADRETVAELMSSRVRDHTQVGFREATSAKVAADVQAALAALGRRRGVTAERRRLDLYCCGLSDADLSQGDWRQAMFYYSFLDDVSFAEAKLEDAGFSFCRGEGVAFSDASARAARFVRAAITNSWFLSADVTGADFSGCDLTGTDFGRRDGLDGRPPCRPAIVAAALMPGAILKDAIFCGVDLSKVRGLTQDQLGEAITDQHTIMPEAWGGMKFDPASSH